MLPSCKHVKNIPERCRNRPGSSTLRHVYKTTKISIWIKLAMQCNLITMTSQWPRRCLKSPASWLFTQSFIRAQIKENIKAPRHWPLCGEFTGTGEFPAQRASNAENVSIWWRHHANVRTMALTGHIQFCQSFLGFFCQSLLFWIQ